MASILVVDDEPAIIEILQLDLEADGHRVLWATNGDMALKIARDERPDAILLDIAMPGISGLDTLTTLQKTRGLRDIPVLMVTASADSADIVECLDRGAHDYITKPIIYPILAARLRTVLRLQENQQKLGAANEELRSLAMTDTLTRTYNRRHLFALAEAEIAKAQRYQRPFSVFTLNADRFKHINDSYGHAAGDKALLAIADSCQYELRTSDILARLGGEEFAICCPDTPLDGAKILAERIRRHIENTTLEYEGENIKFTCSFGVVTLGDDEDFSLLLDRADKLMYLAKRTGRNRIKVQGQDQQ